MVQNAIWYAEDEYYNDTDRKILKKDYDLLISSVFGTGTTDFTVDGWDIKVVNIVSKTSGDNQSQLVGERIPSSPVPEPASMLLLGLGLTGLAAARKKAKS